MEIGDFFIVSDITPSRAATIGACGWHHYRKHNKKFKRKMVSEGVYRFERIQ
jgi:hypothetical protein